MRMHIRFQDFTNRKACLFIEYREHLIFIVFFCKDKRLNQSPIKSQPIQRKHMLVRLLIFFENKIQVIDSTRIFYRSAYFYEFAPVARILVIEGAYYFPRL